MKKKINQYICEINNDFFTGNPVDIGQRLLNYKTEIYALGKQIIDLEGVDNFTINVNRYEDEVCIELWGERLETDAEYETRINREIRQEQLNIANQKAKEEKEKILLAELKAKYETGN